MWRVWWLTITKQQTKLSTEMLNEQPTTKQTNEMQQANSDGDDEGHIIYLLMVVVAVSSRGLRHHYRHRYV